MKRGLAIGLGAVALAAAAGLVGAVVADEANAGSGRRKEVKVHRALHGGGGRLGVTLSEVASDDVARLKLGTERGALVREVAEDSAAEEAGLKAGDVILGFQGEKVHSATQLARLVRETPAGRKVELEVSREGETQRLTATLRESRGARSWGEMSELPTFDFDLDDLPVPPRAPDAPHPPRAPRLDRDWDGFFFGNRPPGRLGIRYQELDGQLARYFKVEDGGLLVTHVEKGSAAEKAGLRAGDVLVKVGDEKVEDGADLRRAVRAAEPGAGLKLTVQRDGQKHELTVTLPDDSKPSGAPV